MGTQKDIKKKKTKITTESQDMFMKPKKQYISIEMNKLMGNQIINTPIPTQNQSTNQINF